nr:5-oxoprolinase subunit PxpA [Mycolicibacterium goodii]
MGTLDLNCDVGEGFGAWRISDDEAFLDIVAAANVACGFHAGDPRTMREVCTLAVERGVAIGAHVGYRDLAGFGRRFVDVAPVELIDELVYQLGALDAIARSVGGRVRYVKPHGALYHAVFAHDGQASAVVEAIRRYDPQLLLLGQPSSRLFAHAMDAGLDTVVEAFADRGYAPDGRLVPRGLPGALVTDPIQVAQQCARLANYGELVAVDGTVLRLQPGSICVHSDTPGGAAIAMAVRTALQDAGVTSGTFA